MKNKFNVLVLMTTYNGEKFVGSQIESIINQKNINLKLIISDDQSSDSTKNILNTFEKKYPKIIKLVFQKKRIGSSGKHFFHLISEVKLSNSIDFVCLSDQDDEWFADKIIKSINLLKQTNTFGYSSNYFLKNESNLKFYDKISKQKLYDYFFESPGPGCTFTISKKLFLSFQKKVRKDFPVNITYHDWLIYAFARSNNFNWIIDDNPSINYRQHSNNVIGENVSIKAKFIRLKLLYSGWWLNQINSIILWLDNDKSKKFYNKYFYKRHQCLGLLFIINHCRRKNFDALIGIFSIIFLKFILFR